MRGEKSVHFHILRCSQDPPSRAKLTLLGSVVEVRVRRGRSSRNQVAITFLNSSREAQLLNWTVMGRYVMFAREGQHQVMGSF